MPLRLSISISKDTFEAVLGPLQQLMSEYSQWRYGVAAAKEFVKNAAGVGHCKVSDFVFEGISAQVRLDGAADWLTEACGMEWLIG